jgi:hypothetical protein
MKKLIVLLALLLAIPAQSMMLIGFGGGESPPAPSIVFDKYTSGGYSVNDFSFSVTPVGTPKAVILYVFHYNAVSDAVNSATYGGVSMTEVSGSPLLKTNTEAMGIYVYFLGSSIPTGTQTVVVDTGAVSSNMSARVVTLTATGDTSVTDTTTISGDNLTNPSGSLTLGGVESWSMFGFISAHDDVGSVVGNWETAGVNLLQADFGTEVFRAGYYTATTSDVTIGATQTAEDFVGFGIAVRVAP